MFLRVKTRMLEWAKSKNIIIKGEKKKKSKTLHQPGARKNARRKLKQRNTQRDTLRHGTQREFYIF